MTATAGSAEGRRISRRWRIINRLACRYGCSVRMRSSLRRDLAPDAAGFVRSAHAPPEPSVSVAINMVARSGADPTRTGRGAAFCHLPDTGVPVIYTPYVAALCRQPWMALPVGWLFGGAGARSLVGCHPLPQVSQRAGRSPASAADVEFSRGVAGLLQEGASPVPFERAQSLRAELHISMNVFTGWIAGCIDRKAGSSRSLFESSRREFRGQCGWYLERQPRPKGIESFWNTPSSTGSCAALGGRPGCPCPDGIGISLFQRPVELPPAGPAEAMDQGFPSASNVSRQTGDVL